MTDLALYLLIADPSYVIRLWDVVRVSVIAAGSITVVSILVRMWKEMGL